jgi:predicted TIM-barrel fold metal-dependent hydrolase
MKIFDAHFHVDNLNIAYNIDVTKKNIIFNSVEEYKQKSYFKSNHDVISLIYDYKHNLDFVRDEISNYKIKALKIHSRLQQIADHEYEKLFQSLSDVLPERMPVIIDAFYTGVDYDFQPNLARIIQLIKLFPKTPFIIAHSGGIKVLEYFLHLRCFDNVYFELSFSLAYLKYSSVNQDFKVLLKFGNYKKIIFGTDYPYIDAKTQLEVLLEMFFELKISDEKANSILFNNSDELFSN